VALSELSNATCWFDPTHDGTLLSWERGLGLSLQPGLIVDYPDELNRRTLGDWARFRVDCQPDPSLVVQGLHHGVPSSAVSV